MDAPTSQSPSTALAEEDAVRALYLETLRGWNRRDAGAFAACFTEDGCIIGFDGTPVDGRAEIAGHIGAIFASHQTPAYITKVKQVRFLTDDVAVLRGIAGMPSLATATINPTLNSIQSLVAHKRDGVWRAALFQNTPAQFHGRPEAVSEMTEELQAALDAQQRRG
ncbi:MAG TPA: SgcJ/EcaC family oxidoreductase [Ktedonobacterales bacterium]